MRYKLLTMALALSLCSSLFVGCNSSKADIMSPSAEDVATDNDTVKEVSSVTEVKEKEAEEVPVEDVEEQPSLEEVEEEEASEVEYSSEPIGGSSNAVYPEGIEVTGFDTDLCCMTGQALLDEFQLLDFWEGMYVSEEIHTTPFKSITNAATGVPFIVYSLTHEPDLLEGLTEITDYQELIECAADPDMISLFQSVKDDLLIDNVISFSETYDTEVDGRYIQARWLAVTVVDEVTYTTLMKVLEHDSSVWEFVIPHETGTSEPDLEGLVQEYIIPYIGDN